MFTRRLICLISCFALGAFCAPSFVFAEVDTDGDGLTDLEELFFYTNPLKADTDGDGYIDGLEVAHDYSPHVVGAVRLADNDFDGDGLNDWAEYWFGSDIGVADTDGDGYSDYEEVMGGFDPTAADKGKRRFSQKVVVDLTNQRIKLYVDRYVKVFDAPISSGNPQTPTPVGNFEIERKVDMKRYVGADYNLPNVKWNLQFKPMYYIHTAYWHDDFGKRTRSHGCINMREDDAKVLYDYIDVGVPVEIIGETPRGYYVQS